MIRLSVGRVTGFLAASFACIGAAAVEAPVSVCTAGPEGNYYLVGQEMAAHANPRYVKITVVETEGSMDNMQRMERQECGAAIVQSDAFVVYEARHPNRPVQITRNRFLYAEYAHLICRRDTKIATTSDLLKNSQRHKILVGDQESGSALTWHAFTLLDARYSQLPIENVGGQDALQLVLDNQAQCMFFVSGLGSEIAREADERGADLRLIPISEEVLRTAKFGAETLYEPRVIPKDYYSNLEKGSAGPGVETLTVGAILIIDRQWEERYPNGPSALLGAATGAMPAIAKRAMAGLK